MLLAHNLSMVHNPLGAGKVILSRVSAYKVHSVEVPYNDLETVSTVLRCLGVAYQLGYYAQELFLFKDHIFTCVNKRGVVYDLVCVGHLDPYAKNKYIIGEELELISDVLEVYPPVNETVRI